MARRIIGNDLTKVYETPTSRTAIETLFWGDTVEHLRTEGGREVIRFPKRDKLGNKETIEAYLSRKTRFADERPLLVRFVDVGQGDGAILESPSGRLMVIDGGEGEHLRRYFASVFKKRPTPVEAIVATHGDADHYSGLTKLLEGFDGKRVVAPRTVFHNGLVKRPSTKENGKRRSEAEMFGDTATRDGETFCVELADDVRAIGDEEMNEPFRAWKAALNEARDADGNETEMRRLAFGDRIDVFADEEIAIDVLGPIADTVGGAPALRCLHDGPDSKSISASHTVNGHSVVLRVRYGNVRFLFAADLNEESEELLLSACREAGRDLGAEVLKVPHHGSADFSSALLSAAAPIVSVVSSGDESTRTEYIHPRANLLAALGRASRTTVDRPLVYVTEMVAFFQRLSPEETARAGAAEIATPERLYRKLQYGIVHVRTDGERLLVVVPSGKEDFVEAYAYTVDPKGIAASVPVDAA